MAGDFSTNAPIAAKAAVFSANGAADASPRQRRGMRAHRRECGGFQRQQRGPC